MLVLIHMPRQLTVSPFKVYYGNIVCIIYRTTFNDNLIPNHNRILLFVPERVYFGVSHTKQQKSARGSTRKGLGDACEVLLRVTAPSSGVLYMMDEVHIPLVVVPYHTHRSSFLHSDNSLLDWE